MYIYSMILLAPFILTHFRLCLKPLALMLSMLVSVHMSEARHLVEGVESNVYEEVLHESILLSEKEISKQHEKSGHQGNLLLLGEYYNFISITKSEDPSTHRPRLYILYQQIAYDRKL